MEGVPVLGTHEIVEDRIESGGKEVETAREIEEILIEHSPAVVILEIDVAQSLDVEWSPGDEEEDNNSN